MEIMEGEVFRAYATGNSKYEIVERFSVFFKDFECTKGRKSLSGST